MAEETEPLQLSRVLLEELMQLHKMPDERELRAMDEKRRQQVAAARQARDEAIRVLANEKTEEPERLRAVYKAIHALPDGSSALCLSGGGIRSATFALGVMQQLATLKLLSKFDYLSTISGGGYIGAWLSSFVRRDPEGIRNVEEQMDPERPPAQRTSPLEPEVKPVMWLRRFSNYLTPQLGLLSGDTWAFAASYLRNLLLVWLMFVPFLASLLAIPRLGVAILRHDLYIDLTGVLAGVLILFATGVLALTRPARYRTPGWLTDARFQWYVLCPFVFAAILLVVFWARRHDKFDDWGIVYVALMLTCLASSVTYIIRFFFATKTQRAMHVRAGTSKERYVFKKALWEILAAQVAAVTAASLLYFLAKLFAQPVTRVMLPVLADWQKVPVQFEAPAEFYLCFAVPAVLGVLFVQSALFVGISSWFNEEYDREWWGRAAGWVLIAAVMWIALTAITIYGPAAIYYAPKFFGSLTAGTGLVSILLGRSSKTSANAKEQSEKESSGTSSTLVNVVLGLLAPVFAVCILALISLCTSLLLEQFHPPDRIRKDQLEIAALGRYEVALKNIDGRDVPKGWTFKVANLPAVERDRIAVYEHLWTVDRTPFAEGLFLVFGLLAFSLLVSFFLGANQFSMHGLYRNRLIRCYLGASRSRKRNHTNAFSGFDPSDNIPMHRLRPELFWGNTFRNIVRDGPPLAADIELSKFIKLPTRNAIARAVALAGTPGEASDAAVAEAGDLLADDLNQALDALDLTPVDGVVAPNPASNPLHSRAIANRLLLETRFPGAFYPMENHRRPLHVVGTTLNLVESKDLAWQERKGSSFTVSALHTGNPRVRYRPSRLFGGPGGVTLGTATAISGAAVSPNMGYNSSPALSFLLTLFNVRLGWWFGNPAKDKYHVQNPSNTLITVLNEAFGKTTDDHDYIYLSDGGHFENLGVYQMVLRRCRNIVVSDAASDASFAFGDLGNAIRKIRIDLGIDIDITEMLLFPRADTNPKFPPKYCAIGTIRYDLVDANAQPGTLLYIKPAVYGDEPRDVGAYAAEFDTFPHQSTGDQWFSESQFESYRQLGYYAVQSLTNGKTPGSIAELMKTAKKYIGSW